MAFRLEDDDVAIIWGDQVFHLPLYKLERMVKEQLLNGNEGIRHMIEEDPAAALMAYGFYRLEQTNADASGISFLPRTFCYVMPAGNGAEQQPQPKTPEEYLQAEFGRTYSTKMPGLKEASSKALHFPITYKGHHSLATIIDPWGDTPFLMHFDSIDGFHETAWVKMKCEDLLNVIRAKLKLKPVKLPVRATESVQQPKGSNACGYHMVANMIFVSDDIYNSTAAPAIPYDEEPYCVRYNEVLPFVLAQEFVDKVVLPAAMTASPEHPAFSRLVALSDSLKTVVLPLHGQDIEFIMPCDYSARKDKELDRLRRFIPDYCQYRGAMTRSRSHSPAREVKVKQEGKTRRGKTAAAAAAGPSSAGPQGMGGSSRKRMAASATGDASMGKKAKGAATPCSSVAGITPQLPDLQDMERKNPAMAAMFKGLLSGLADDHSPDADMDDAEGPEEATQSPGKRNSSKASDAEDKAEQRLQTQLLATLVHEFRGWMKAQRTESKPRTLEAFSAKYDNKEATDVLLGSLKPLFRSMIYLTRVSMLGLVLTVLDVPSRAAGEAAFGAEVFKAGVLLLLAKCLNAIRKNWRRRGRVQVWHQSMFAYAMPSAPEQTGSDADKDAKVEYLEHKAVVDNAIATAGKDTIFGPQLLSQDAIDKLITGWNFRGGRRWNDPRFLSVVSAMLESTSGVYIELVEPVVPLDGEERPPVPDVYAAELAFAAATVELWITGVKGGTKSKLNMKKQHDVQYEAFRKQMDALRQDRDSLEFAWPYDKAQLVWSQEVADAAKVKGREIVDVVAAAAATKTKFMEEEA